jgi:hypothetical protein
MLWSDATPLTPRPRPFNLRSHSMQIPTLNPAREGRTRGGEGNCPNSMVITFVTLKNGSVLCGLEQRRDSVKASRTSDSDPQLLRSTVLYQFNYLTSIVSTCNTTSSGVATATWIFALFARRHCFRRFGKTCNNVRADV